MLKKKSKKENKPKLSRKEKKALKQQIAEKAKFVGERGFGSPLGYIDKDSYIFGRDGKVRAIFDVIFQYGTNHDESTGWINKLIPRDEIEHGDVRFYQRQKGTPLSEERSIIDNRIQNMLSSTLGLFDKSASVSAKKRMLNEDFNLAKVLSGQADTIIDTEMMLVIEADSPENVEIAYDELTTSYKNSDVKGVMLIRRTGTQWREWTNLLITNHADVLHSTDMITTGAGRLFLPSSGFSDEHGAYVGIDTDSYLRNNPAIIDFSGVKNAVIYTGGSRPYVSVYGQGKSERSLRYGGTAIAHAITDANYLNGKRTHHIMLSPNINYYSWDSLVFDMNKEVINPFEVFGKEESVIFDANANFEKVTNMMLLITGLGKDSRERDATKVELMSLVVDWYITRANGTGMYTKTPKDEPHIAKRILATPDHENYPTPRDFLTELRSFVAESSNSNDMARERANLMFKSISTAFDRYSQVFGETTTLPDVFKANDRNIYYDMSNVSGEDTALLDAMFLNTLAYVTNRALAGEMIVIHGLDRLSIPEDYLITYRQRINSKNIGLVSVFEETDNPNFNLQSHSRFVGRLSSQDAVILGRISDKELKQINNSWQRELPNSITDKLLQSPQGLFYFYRKRDYTGALIETHLNL